jgi:hypothetical protein
MFRAQRGDPMWLAVAAIVLAPASASAFQFGVGVEVGGSYTRLVSSEGTFALGLTLEQRFELPVVDLTLWEDLEGPIEFGNGWTFGVVDLGLRAGLAGALFKPYVGFLVNDTFSDDKTAACLCGQAASNVPGLGGDVGVDFAVVFLRLGLELRAYGTLSPPVTGARVGDAVVWQGLFSARAVF